MRNLVVEDLIYGYYYMIFTPNKQYLGKYLGNTSKEYGYKPAFKRITNETDCRIIVIENTNNITFEEFEL